MGPRPRSLYSSKCTLWDLVQRPGHPGGANDGRVSASVLDDAHPVLGWRSTRVCKNVSDFGVDGQDGKENPVEQMASHYREATESEKFTIWRLRFQYSLKGCIDVHQLLLDELEVL